MDAWEAARDIAREIGGGAFADLGERGRIAVNVETVYRTLDPSHRPRTWSSCSGAWPCSTRRDGDARRLDVAGRGRRVRAGRLGGGRRVLAEAGVETVLVAPAPDEVWPARTAAGSTSWSRSGCGPSPARSWPSVRVVGRPRARGRCRAYAVLDNARLHAAARRAGSVRAGGERWRGAAVGRAALRLGQPPAAGRRRSDGRPADRRRHRRRPARPAEAHAGPPMAAHRPRTAFVARFDGPPVPAGSCTLMDWPPAAPPAPGAIARPTFLLRDGPGRRPVPGRGDRSRRAPPDGRRRAARAAGASASRGCGATPAEVLGEERRRHPDGRAGPEGAAGRGDGGRRRAGAPGHRLLRGRRRCGSRPGWPLPCGARSTPATSRPGSRPRRGRRCGRAPGGEPAASSRSGCRGCWRWGRTRCAPSSTPSSPCPTSGGRPTCPARARRVELARAMTAVFRASPGDVRRRLARG